MRGARALTIAHKNTVHQIRLIEHEGDGRRVLLDLIAVVSVEVPSAHGLGCPVLRTLRNNLDLRRVSIVP